MYKGINRILLESRRICFITLPWRKFCILPKAIIIELLSALRYPSCLENDLLFCTEFHSNDDFKHTKNAAKERDPCGVGSSLVLLALGGQDCVQLGVN